MAATEKEKKKRNGKRRGIIWFGIFLLEKKKKIKIETFVDVSFQVLEVKRLWLWTVSCSGLLYEIVITKNNKIAVVV